MGARPPARGDERAAPPPPPGVPAVAGLSDPVYGDPRLAPLYDVFEDDRRDLDAYVALAAGTRRVVDLGCGTGVLAARLAGPGRSVVGIDPAAASVDVARARSGAVTWIVGDAAAIPLTDLVVMTGNAAQAIVDDSSWAATLRHVRRALASGGRFVFESRRPEARDWERWGTPSDVRDVPGVGPVERAEGVTAVAPPLVSFHQTYRFLVTGEVVVSHSTIRFRTLDELTADLAAAGLAVREVRDAPDRPGLEFVVVAGRA